ncbi:hypothetical protein V2J09_022903 [Rumex salicifolius]
MSPSPFQVAALGASPLYPNSIVWSDENLIAVATGHIVTILNPEKPHSPRGVITLTAKDPVRDLGTINRQDLHSACLLPICLTRDRRPCVRSISWSPLGFASNYGCLLGVCTTEGSVKIYSHPYCEFRAEWSEVMDVSDMLHGYISKTNYGEPVFQSMSDGSGLRHDPSIQVLPGNSPPSSSNFDVSSGSIILSLEDANAGLTKIPDFTQVASLSKGDANDSLQIVSVINAEENSRAEREDCSSQLSADKYASRCALISSLVIVWSPVVTLSAVTSDNSSISYCILAIGSKSGHLSLWRIHTPDSYSVEHSYAPKVEFAGLQQIHNAWVTALEWGLYGTDASNPQLLLASGSSDGSVKIWLGDGEDMLRSSEANPAQFSLLTEVRMNDTAPISVISLTMSSELCHKLVLAIGKGSGSVEIWTFEIDKQELTTAGCYPMHDHIVTGLAWDFDGCCLYSCSQDNSMRGWVFVKDSLTEVPLPPNNLSIKSSADLPCAYESCFGVAVSPGNLVLAVVRSFDLDLLHPMYQARTQRAAIDFFWIGGQQQSMSSEFYLELGARNPPALSDQELVCWGSNILWSLKHFERYNKHLVVWDIISALSAFKQRSPAFFEQILLRWLVFLEGHSNLITKKSPQIACGSLPKVSSRQLHLLNIFCRRVILPSCNLREPYSIESFSSDDQHWAKLLLCSEEELRKRLVALTFSSSMSLMSDVEIQKDDGSWKPCGLSQMLCWVNANADGHQLKHLASEVKKLSTRLQDAGVYEEEELCTYCSAPVEFESAESASCRGLMRDQGSPQRHGLSRCTASMQVCPATPLWFCVCCERRCFKLGPPELYKLPCYPSQTGYDGLLKSKHTVPLCPFCGILLQRLQPDFLLSSSPV